MTFVSEVKMRRLSLMKILLLALASVLFLLPLSCGGDDDDDSRGGVYVPPDDDTNDDVDDDVDDDADDDADDDVNDDADDDTQECIDEDSDTYGDNCSAGPDCNDENGEIWQWLDAYADEDEDGFGGGELLQMCSGDSLPTGFFAEYEDCDDANFLINPGAPELPDDGIDQNCDDIDLTLSDETGVFVTPTGLGAGAGTMADPVRTLFAGVFLATEREKVVFVAAGDYVDDVETSVSIFGGYEPDGWTRDMEANLTTLTAETIAAITLVNSNRGQHRRLNKDESKERNIFSHPVAIQGFTLIGGSGDSYSDGIINNEHVHATIANNTINGGSGESSTSGVHNGSDAMMLLVDNIINGGSPTGDESYSYGFVNWGTATLANNIINGGSPPGGDSFSYGFYNLNYATTLVNNVIDGGSGGQSCGIYNNDGTMGDLVIINNIINAGVGDASFPIVTCATGTGILLNNNILNVDVNCMIFQHDYFNDTYECVAETPSEVNACAWTICEEASGHISNDPLFVDPDGGDFHLQDTSPCMDTGINPVPAYIPLGFLDFDFDGDARPYGAGWDIGADEWRP
jgi:Putative metal-binding motif